MAEPMFGSTPQPWSSIPTFGYLQPPISFTPRPSLISPISLPSVSPPIGTMAPPGVGPSAAAVVPTPMPAIGSLGTGAGLSAVIAAGMQPVQSLQSMTGDEIAIGVTASALLAAIAVRRGQPLGPSTDLEVEDFICDALDLLPGAGDVEVRCENGRAALTGTVPYKRLKRDAGEIAWAVPTVNDVQNSITIVPRRRARSGRDEAPTPALAQGRKQS